MGSSFKGAAMQKLAGSIQARKAMDCNCKKKYPKGGSLLNMLERYQLRLPTSSISPSFLLLVVFVLWDRLVAWLHVWRCYIPVGVVVLSHMATWVGVWCCWYLAALIPQKCFFWVYALLSCFPRYIRCSFMLFVMFRFMLRYTTLIHFWLKQQ